MSTTHRDYRYAALLTALSIAAIWIRRALGPLWLDETVAYYTAMGDWAETTERAARYHLQPPTYYWILSALRQAGLTSEIWLRTPSLVAAAAAAYLISRIGARLFDRETGFLAALVFVASDGAIFAADSARPYALGMLAVTASVWALVALRDPAMRRCAIAVYAASTAFACHLMPFFFPILGVHAVIALLSWRERPAMGRDLTLAFAAAGVLLVPVALSLRSLADEASVFDIPGRPPAARVVLALFPVALPTLLVVTLLAANGIKRGYLSLSELRSSLLNRDGAWILAWHLLPPLTFLAFSLATGRENWFSERYFSWNAPGLALLSAMVLRSFEPPSGRKLSACLLSVLILAAEPHRPIFTEDWRSAASDLARSLEAPAEPFLFYSGLVESLHAGKLEDPAQRDYLTAPIQYYPVPGRAVLLPYRLDRPADEEYWKREIEPVIAERDEILVLGADVIAVAGRPASARIARRLGEHGMRVEAVRRYGKTFVMKAVRE